MTAATDRQTDFIKTLFAEAQEGISAADEAILAQVTPQVETVQDVLVKVIGGGVPDRRQASDAITVLKNVNAVLRRAKAAANLPAAFQNRSDIDRVINNRFDTKCKVCHEPLAVNSGWAIHTRHGWENWCQVCADETPEDRAAREAAENEARLARAAEARKEAEAKAARAKVVAELKKDTVALLTDSVRRSGQDGKSGVTVGVALPSATGNNDLDFFAIDVKVTLRGERRLSIARVIGGHANQTLTPEQAVAAAERLCCVEDFRAAMATFGQEIGFCGKCGRHLTDEDSRAHGIGPTCRKGF